MAPALDNLLPESQAEHVSFDADLGIADYSAGAARFADNPAAVAVGTDVREAFPELAGAEQELADVLRGARPSYTLYAVCRSIGRDAQIYLNIHVSAPREPDAGTRIALMRIDDITHWMSEIQKKTQTANDALLVVHALTASKEYIENIFDAMAEMLVVTSSRGLITAVNRTTLSLTGFRNGDLIGRPITVLLPGEVAPEAMDGNWVTPLAEFRCTSRHGADIPVSFSRAPMRGSGDILHGVVYIGRDLRAEKQAAAAISRLESEKQSLHQVLQRDLQPSEIIWSSPAMRSLMRDLHKVAVTDTTVLVSGETGSGKELVAREIHRLSPRRDALLVTVNCAALPPGLIESELFGHEKGAFTGALQRRIGRFELADGGTVFLDEVGELPLSAQATLLRVLQEQSLERVGGSQAISVDVRVIAATNRDLSNEVAQGRFRDDLLFRLNVFPLHVPPLRDRRQDVRPLAEHFLSLFARRMKKPVPAIHPSALGLLERYSWPGNVRELANVLERALIVCEGATIEPGHLALLELQQGRRKEAERFDDVARDHLLSTLHACKGIIEGPMGAAAKLGLKPATLRSRMKKLGIVRTTGGFQVVSSEAH